MSNVLRILIAGESWVTHSIHQKGFDSFTTTSYNEGVGPLRAALEAGGFKVDYLPNHVAATDFPSTAAELKAYAEELKKGQRRIDLPSMFKSHTDNPKRWPLAFD